MEVAGMDLAPDGRRGRPGGSGGMFTLLDGRQASLAGMHGRPVLAWFVAGGEPAVTGGAPGTGRGARRPGLGGLWLLLAPLACCGGPLLIGALAAAGALAWAGLGLAAAAVMGAAAVLAIRRRRRAGCPPAAPGEACGPDKARAAWEGRRR
jgi:hypothetical protein